MGMNSTMTRITIDLNDSQYAQLEQLVTIHKRASKAEMVRVLIGTAFIQAEKLVEQKMQKGVKGL